MYETEGEGVVCNRWDQVMHQLSSQPRRQIVISLLDAPEERRRLLPEAALPSTRSVDPEQFTTGLKHHHLPALAKAGYIRWEQDPFCVQRGPRFEEVGSVIQVLLTSSAQLPESLTQGSLIETYEK